MKNFKYLVYGAAIALALVSCGKATVKGHIKDTLPEGSVVVAKTIEGSSLRVLDSIKVKNGAFRYALDVPEGQPEFVYFYYGDSKIASVLLDAGDKLAIECDTLGTWTVEGSEDCELLRQNELEFSKFASKPEITVREFIGHYRKMAKYVFTHSKSLTVVPVMFQRVGDVPVFSQLSDGVMFTAIADSLSQVYPDSRYVQMLRAEGTARENALALQNMISSAGEQDYIDMTLPNVNGTDVTLSSSVLKATLVVFWDCSDALNKIYNLEVLKPLWDEFHSRGLQIYQVNLGAPKADWAHVVDEQKMPWINVYDMSGQSMMNYAVTEVPSAYLIGGGATERMPKVDLQALRSAVSKVL